MTKRRRHQFFFALALVVLAYSGFTWAVAAEEKMMLHYKPWSDPASYQLELQATASLETNRGALEGGDPGRAVIIRKHRDQIALDLQVQEVKDGLLDGVMTVKNINVLPPRRGGLSGVIGDQYKRTEIVGNRQKTTIDLQGGIHAATGLPHFASGDFYGDEDGPPLDMYRVLLMVFPRFPLKLVGQGDRWQVKDEVEVKLADVTAITGAIAPLNYSVTSKIKRDLSYTLVGFTEKSGHRSAHIRFEGRFSADTEGKGPTKGSYKEGGGKVNGELFFAPSEGKVVELTMASNLTESFSQDGAVIMFWLNPKERIWLNAFEGRTYPPLVWHTEQKVKLELVGASSTKRAP